MASPLPKHQVTVDGKPVQGVTWTQVRRVPNKSFVSFTVAIPPAGMEFDASQLVKDGKTVSLAVLNSGKLFEAKGVFTSDEARQGAKEGSLYTCNAECAWAEWQTPSEAQLEVFMEPKKGKKES